MRSEYTATAAREHPHTTSFAPLSFLARTLAKHRYRETVRRCLCHEVTFSPHPPMQGLSVTHGALYRALSRASAPRHRLACVHTSLYTAASCDPVTCSSLLPVCQYLTVSVR